MSFGAHLRRFYREHRPPTDLEVVARGGEISREVGSDEGIRYGFIFEHVLYTQVEEFAHSIGAEIVAVGRHQAALSVMSRYTLSRSAYFTFSSRNRSCRPRL